jgi:hypothetical protein
MTKAGMNANHTVVGAHSLGGVMAQTYLASEAHDVDALVLMGATVLRKYRDAKFSVPVLTLDGDLDGLLHITRQAEAYYHQVQLAGGPEASVTGQPVVLLKGLNHWNFAAGTGTPPSNVKKNDLKSEVSAEDGHSAIAKMISDYVSAWIGSGSVKTSAMSALKEAITNTGTMVAPLIAAMEQEGHHYLKMPCDSDYPTNPTCQYPKYPDKSLGPAKGPPKPLPPKDCTCGSPWVMSTAQKMMAGLEMTSQSAATITTRDAFHDVSDVRPFHLPHIFTPTPGTACKLDSANAGASCHFESTTVTMPVYDSKDGLDTGLYPTTASELRTKLKSREAVWQQAGITGVNYSAVDRYNTSLCQSINQAALDWAMANAGKDALARFAAKGQPYKIIEDKWAPIGATGPEWIKMAMTYTPTADKKYVEVQAPYFSGANKKLGDQPYTDPVGYHYCKLLSPARAMEWIYCDGLRQFGGDPQ